ncbi:ArsR family transcriptional regulator [Isoptericola jiangsuensis]|uniref:ArsR family transcriptional regulator n=1 Tax=Isoptericola jiangsuensis TaxID=548579 RepID=A0A2A9ET37_9MICO|nr:metalloregulator ArsR/SmtB family transcription factor [Isoptericola jiangsuensis]PFG41736.1 ArsR family transcriptional regulator [Isoptericola jiangsuensis]
MTTTVPLPLAPTADAGCCTPERAPAVTPDTAQDLARTFKALADPARVQLLATVAASPDAEACVCDLTAPVGLSQPTVSHHLKILVEAGLLHREQRGRWAYYRLVPDAVAALAGALTAVTAADD